ncbi:glycosyl hydrolase family 39 [Opitutaceae bacterium TAV1]|nr:glycosyl hydrolase family 39 [Opitutaceae bacterium TAV1]
MKPVKTILPGLFFFCVGPLSGFCAGIQSPAEFHQDFPASSAADGNIDTWARPRTSGRTPADDPRVDYVLTFDQPTTINRIRFFQHPHAFATAYRIVGRTRAGSAVFDRVLVTVDDPRTPAGEWVEHRVPDTGLVALKLETEAGFAERDIPYPAIAEFQADRIDPENVKDAEPALSASVALDEVLAINGVSRIHDTMFSVCNITGGKEFVRKYIEPLNLGVIPVWTEDFMSTLPVPEDPVAPGKFDRQFFESEAFGRAFAGKRSGLDSVGEAGAFANMSLVKAPAWMRRNDFRSTGTGRFKTETRFFPPVDPAEWGELAGHTLKAINDHTGGLVKWAYIWNEPNAERYLPVPWREKSRTYMELFKAAVPPIKRLNPGIKVGGPVITGGGVLGWSRGEKGDEASFWDSWSKRFIDECGALADHFDAHYYGVDPDCLKAEANLLANYAHNTLGRPFPIAGSESNVILRVAKQVDPVAGRWRYVTVNYADMLLSALDLPDRIESLSYFYITDWKGFFGLFTDGDLEPNPAYRFYYLLRHLRGERLPGESGSDRVNLVAARNGGRFNIVMQNKRGSRQTVNLTLAGLPVANHNGTVDLERLEYDPATRMVALTGTPVPVENGRVHFRMEPYGMYSITGDTGSALPAKAVRSRKDYYGDSVFQELSAVDVTGDAPPLVLKVSLPDRFRQAEKSILKLSVGGIPYARPRRIVDRRVPLVVRINGQSHRVFVTNYNEIELPVNLLKADNTIEVSRDPEAIRVKDDPRIVSSEKIWILSVSLELRTEEEKSSG